MRGSLRDPLTARPDEAVAETPHRLYKLRLVRVVAELVAQALDVDVHGAFVYELVLAPDLAEQGGAGEDASRRAGEGMEQLELAGGEGDFAVPLADEDLIRVDLQVPHEEPAGVVVPAALLFSEDLLHARHELPRVDRGAHVVVRAELDADDAVHRVLVPEQRHGGDVRFLDGAYDLEAPLVREAVVHDGDLELLAARHLAGLVAGAGRDHTPPLPRQSPPQMKPLLVIPDDQQNRPAQYPAFDRRTTTIPQVYPQNRTTEAPALRDTQRGGIIGLPMRS